MFENWDNLLLSSGKGSIFHTSAWAKVLHESYNYKPLYFTVISNTKIKTLIPIMEVNSLLTGKRGVSLPFTDVCEPIISKDLPLEEVINFIIRYGRKSQWKYMELRIGGKLEGIEVSKTYFNHVLRLDNNENKIFSRFRKSTKGNIKKAINKGVKIEFCNSLDSIKNFYKLHCRTRKKHGLPPQPWSFFIMYLNTLYHRKKGLFSWQPIIVELLEGLFSFASAIKLFINLVHQ